MTDIGYAIIRSFHLGSNACFVFHQSHTVYYIPVHLSVGLNKKVNSLYAKTSQCIAYIIKN